jgi:hypothetical protein
MRRMRRIQKIFILAMIMMIYKMEALLRLRCKMSGAEKSVQKFADFGRASQRLDEAWGWSKR